MPPPVERISLGSGTVWKLAFCAPVGKAVRRAKTAMKACIFMLVVKFRRPYVVLGGVNLRILFIRRHPRFSHFRIRAAHGHACSVALSRLIKGLKTL